MALHANATWARTETEPNATHVIQPAEPVQAPTATNASPAPMSPSVSRTAAVQETPPAPKVSTRKEQPVPHAQPTALTVFPKAPAIRVLMDSNLSQSPTAELQQVTVSKNAVMEKDSNSIAMTVTTETEMVVQLTVKLKQAGPAQVAQALNQASVLKECLKELIYS